MRPASDTARRDVSPLLGEAERGKIGGALSKEVRHLAAPAWRSWKLHLLGVRLATHGAFSCDSQASEAMNSAEGVRRGAAAQHDERREKTTRATRFRRVALFAERPGGTGKKVKDREIDVAPWFCTGPCASKAANHWQATAPRRAPDNRGGVGTL